MTAPSGAQHELRLGTQRATIVEVGGGVREYRDGERDVLHSYARDAMCDGGHGAPLIPWPNRLADGRYTFDGTDRQLALTEPSKHNAIHGLLRWRPWRALAGDDTSVTMAAEIFPMTGYPHRVEVRVQYTLDADGLTVRTSARNAGETACPFGAGQHPYVSVGDAPVDEATLTFAAATRITLDPDRGLPTGSVPVEPGSDVDFRAGRRIGAQQIDDPFTDLERDAAGRVQAQIRGGDGRTVAWWAGPGYDVLQVYTADTLAPARRRTAIALEPMTCPPNAFRTGDGLRRLEPGETIELEWGVRLLP